VSRLIYLAKTGMTVPLNRIPLDGYEQDTDYVIDLDLVANQAVDEAVLMGDPAGWASVSPDGGSNYYAITNDRTTSYDLGPRSAGSRLAIKIKINIAGAVSIRGRFFPLTIGLGS